MDMYTSLPCHVAIIMDGNGRWAEQKGLSRQEGHRAGLDNVRRVVACLDEHRIPYATLYTFSTENWNRPQDEVECLMDLLDRSVAKQARDLHKKNVVIHHVGSEENLSSSLLRKIRRAVKLTAGNTGMHLGIAFNYGGRAEIIKAVRAIAAAGMPPDEIDEVMFGTYLHTAGFPDVDLLIRTGGEYRTSNFLPWQAVYAEYYFTPVLWPDFDEKETLKALKAYSQRQRRFGTLKGNGEC